MFVFVVAFWHIFSFTSTYYTIKKNRSDAKKNATTIDTIKAITSHIYIMQIKNENMQADSISIGVSVTRVLTELRLM